jgi:hypothetical protein
MTAPVMQRRAAPARKTVLVTYHLDLVGRHDYGDAVSCVTGWIAAERGHSILSLGLRADNGEILRCHYPFDEGVAPRDIAQPPERAGTSF